ncbi:MAG: hypothetical protein KI792_03925 [Alphaproteobacteria bacterium]|nr:hypothetical protein [Alphaproteobacteria bacterium SS10]
MTDQSDKPAQTSPAGRQSVPIETRVEDAIVLMEDLTDLLDEETEAVQNHDFQKFAELQADKVDLATEYQSLISRLQKRQLELKDVDGELRETLVEVAERLNAAMDENEQAIDVARRGTRSVIDTIVQSVRKAVSPNDAYTEDASMSEPSKKVSGAVSLDEEL